MSKKIDDTIKKLGALGVDLPEIAVRVKGNEMQGGELFLTSNLSGEQKKELDDHIAELSSRSPRELAMGFERCHRGIEGTAAIKIIDPSYLPHLPPLPKGKIAAAPTTPHHPPLPPIPKDKDKGPRL